MTEWEPIELERVSGRWLGVVVRHVRAGRWRWAVALLEDVKRGPAAWVERKARAVGYARGKKRALAMADSAIRALERSYKP